MSKKRHGYGSTQSSEVEADSNQVEVNTTSKVEAMEPEVVVEEPAAAPVAVESTPVVETAAPEKSEAPVLRLRYGTHFTHPKYGAVQVVTVPVDGKCMIRVEATGKSYPYSVN